MVRRLLSNCVQREACRSRISRHAFLNQQRLTLTQVPLTSTTARKDRGAYEILQSNSNCRSICGGLIGFGAASAIDKTSEQGASFCQRCGDGYCASLPASIFRVQPNSIQTLKSCGPSRRGRHRLTSRTGLTALCGSSNCLRLFAPNPFVLQTLHCPRFP